ncbi:hypothetical protein SUGI_0917600 [Cryptomeria japonica]|nr:hypothetical protein SUGI_0917600 [Cryptomeria japonica]
MRDTSIPEIVLSSSELLLLLVENTSSLIPMWILCYRTQGRLTSIASPVGGARVPSSAKTITLFRKSTHLQITGFLTSQLASSAKLIARGNRLAIEKSDTVIPDKS